MSIQVKIGNQVGSGVLVLTLGRSMQWFCRVEDPWEDVKFDGVFCHEDQYELVAARLRQMASPIMKPSSRGRRTVG